MQKFLIVMLLLTQLACRQKKTEAQKAPEINMLPYKEMLLGEIKAVKDNPRVVRQYTLRTDGTILDSAILDYAGFSALAANFYEPDISDKAIKNNYTENSFEDLSNKSYNFSYDTKNAELPVKTLILSFGKENQSELKSLQLTKEYTKNSVTVLQQLYWRSNKYFTISTSRDSNHTETMQLVKVTWGETK